MVYNIDMEKRKKRVALSSVFASLLLTLLKLIVGLLTGSIGIISEAAHSGLDLGAAFLTYLAVRVSGRPADPAHHYGHEKIESVSALVETGLLLLTSVWIVYEAIQRLLFKSVEIQVTWYAFAVMTISIIVDLSRSRALRKVARETSSQALEADALHFQTDIYSSAVVLLGLTLVSLGINGADAFAAIGVAIVVAIASFRLGKRTVDVLIDAAPEGLSSKVAKIANKVEGVVSVDRLRVRPAGASVFIDMVVTVGRKSPLEQVHRITKTIEQKVQKVIPEADVVVHVKPIAIEGESIIERVGIIARNNGASAHDICVYTMEGEKFINFDLEVDNNYNLEQAHKIATHIEDDIRSELGGDININTHIEPMGSSEIVSEKIAPKQMAEIQKILDYIKKTILSIKDIHNVFVHSMDKRLFISLHCILDKKLSIEEIHRLCDEIENIFKERLPNVERVLVHTEPEEESTGGKNSAAK